MIDNLPEIIENEVLNFLLEKGYSEVYIYSDIEEKASLYLVPNLLNRETGLKPHVRIETPDSRILIAQDFDQRFTYFLGPAELIEQAINYLSLEGFYCDNQTSESWSFEIIPEDKRIDWRQDTT